MRYRTLVPVTAALVVTPFLLAAEGCGDGTTPSEGTVVEHHITKRDEADRPLEFRLTLDPGEPGGPKGVAYVTPAQANACPVNAVYPACLP